jgi:DNA processing protein
MNSARYYLGFNRINGIGPARLERLVERLGSVEAAWHASPTQLMAAGLDAKLIEALVAARRTIDLDAETARASAAGLQILARDNPDYPANLRDTPAPPPVIFVRGRLSLADGWAVAVVGTRSPTTYGREATQRLVAELAEAGVTIVSGLALGVDTLAHATAIEAGGRTIAVLPCGADMVYPERNRELATQISENGALVSEFPLGLRPTPQLFPVRNRLISALARGVLVIEAGDRSGALITVEYALDQGRDVFAVPGSIFSRMSAGTNQLLRNGAGIVTSARDLLDALNMTTADSQRDVRTTLPEDPTEAAVLTFVTYEPVHVDTLARRVQMPVATVSATLALLELKGLVRQANPMHYVLKR